jgi:UDP-N-acetylglucosamine 2-epimerase
MRLCLSVTVVDLCLVVGDVTSTMACSITAQKMGVPVAHVEGGLRSGDWSMPEEINRMVTDAISNEPQPYLEFVYLLKHAKAVITDSGGVTEEATILGVPCLTMHDTTERPETVTVGTNVLIGADPARLAPALEDVFSGRWKTGGVPDLWDGRAGEGIVEHLERLLVASAK